MPEPAMLDYFYGDEAEQYTFYRIPKVLFTDPAYRRISSDAKILYGLMLDRMGLSVRNGWLDEYNRVYSQYRGCADGQSCCPDNTVSKIRLKRCCTGLFRCSTSF